MTHEEKLIIALDLPKNQVASFIGKIPKGPIFKIGMRLFTSSGPEVVRNVLEKGHKVFLDMKFMDIPNTVAEASESAFELGLESAQGSCSLSAPFRQSPERPRPFPTPMLASKSGNSDSAGSFPNCSSTRQSGAMS